MSEPSGLEVAVIGMAGRFPGANSIDEYWDLIRAGREALTSATDAELAAIGVPASVYQRPDYIRPRGVLADAGSFDAEFFGMTPVDAATLDPQQRVFLECCWHALEDAGYRGGQADGQLIGVYGSMSISTYLLRHLLPQARLVADVGEYQLVLGNDKDTLAARVSYLMDLRGPSIVVQSACSSSLLGVHLASQALISHDCDIALVGGAAIRLPQEEGVRHREGSIMSPDGRCRSFDASSRGTVGGNGAGVVVLKRLTDALHDNDTIHAVILGSAAGNDGASRIGFTAPGADGQASVIRLALDVAAVKPASIGFVEGHGSATALGDSIEVAALNETFGSAPEPWCALGSVKALVGHLDAAAGVAGFIKAVLSVRDGIIPPSPYFQQPNAELAAEGSPFYVSREGGPWPSTFDVRRAGVSSFGMGGSSVHVVVEQPPVASSLSAYPSRADVVVMSGRTAQALAEVKGRLTRHLADHPELALADAAATLQLGRRRLDYRAAAVCRNGTSADAGPLDIITASGPVHREVAFLFPGQGTQQSGMVADLYERFPVFREQLDRCATMTGERLDLDLVDALTRQDPATDDLLRRTRNAQPALFAVEYATAMLWQSWGVRPRAMLGHSIGEYAAAALADVMDLSDAVRLVCERGRLMDGLVPGAMIAVEAEPEVVAGLGVEIAARNAPNLCVLSGPADRIAEAEQALDVMGISHRRLHTSHAFHSMMVDPILAEYTALVSAVALRAPSIPFVSNVSGTWITHAQATDPAYWAAQIRQPVQFSAGVGTLLERENQLLLEVGPGTSLTSLAGQHGLHDKGHRAIASSGADRKLDDYSLAHAWAWLWVEGFDLDEVAFRAGRPGHRVRLPTYPFSRDRHWIDLPTGLAEQAPRTVITAPPPTPSPVGALAELTTSQAIVKQTWCDLMGLADPGLNDNFFSLGGHSMLASRIVARISETAQVELPVGAVLANPTIAGLAEQLDVALEAASSGPDLDELSRQLSALPVDELTAELRRLNELDEKSGT